MRVLHVIPSIDRLAGGPTTALLGLTKAQAKAGLEVKVLTAYRQVHDRVAGQVFQNQGVAVEMLGPVAGKLQRHPDLAFLADQQIRDSHIVHIHAIWEQLLHVSARSAQSRKIPYLVTAHGMLDPWSLAQNKWAKKALLRLRVRKNLNRAAGLHFTSTVERDLVAPMRLRAPKIVEPNGIDLDEFEHLPQRGTFATHVPQVGKRRYILFLGRLHPKKGLDLLIPAFAKIASGAALADVALVVAGPDADGYQHRLRSMIAEHRLEDRVVLPGMLEGEARIAAFTEAALFVLPSYQENFGIAVAESLVAGTPVVISDQVNIHADITAADVGGVVPTNVAALAGEMRRWMEDGDLRRRAAAIAPAFVRDRYDWDQIARRWRRHYEDILTR